MTDRRHDDAPDPGAPVGSIEFDRFCDRCGASLLGCAIHREPHYGMMLSRCAACDSPAPSQIHRRILRWRAHWAMLLAAMWLLLVTLTFFGGTVLVLAFSGIAAGATTLDYSTFLEERYELERGDEKQGPTILGVVMRSTDRSRFAAWWAEQDPEAMFAEAGGWRDAVQWRALNLWWFTGAVAAAVGVLSSLLMPGLGRRGRVCWMILVTALLGFLTVMVLLAWQTLPPRTANNIGLTRIGPPFLVASAVVAAACLGLGLALGRGLARRVASIVLPVRLRGAVSALWRMDGLPAPPTRRA